MERPLSSDPRWWFHDYERRPYHAENYRILKRYFLKVLASGPGGVRGTFATYEKAHRSRLTAIFVPKFPLLPADAISHIVGLWAHTGYY